MRIRGFLLLAFWLIAPFASAQEQYTAGSQTRDLYLKIIGAWGLATNGGPTDINQSTLGDADFKCRNPEPVFGIGYLGTATQILPPQSLQIGSYAYYLAGSGLQRLDLFARTVVRFSTTTPGQQIEGRDTWAITAGDTTEIISFETEAFDGEERDLLIVDNSVYLRCTTPVTSASDSALNEAELTPLLGTWGFVTRRSAGDFGDANLVRAIAACRRKHDASNIRFFEGASPKLPLENNLRGDLIYFSTELGLQRLDTASRASLLLLSAELKENTEQRKTWLLKTQRGQIASQMMKLARAGRTYDALIEGDNIYLRCPNTGGNN